MASLVALFQFIKRRDKKNVHLNLTPKKLYPQKKADNDPPIIKFNLVIQN